MSTGAKVILVASVLLILGLGGAAAYWAVNDTSIDKDLVLHTVRKEKLQNILVERGTLESKNNFDVVCRVKARSQGSTVATTIKKLNVEDGDTVKKGDTLMELDSSGLEDQLKQQAIVRDKAKLDWDVAEGNLDIVRSQNVSDLATAELAKVIADIDLRKYIEGEYPAALTDINNRLEQWRDRVSYSNRMVKKGYISASQAQADLFALQKVELEEKTLKLTKERTEKDLQGKVAEAIRTITRVKIQTKSKEETAIKERDAKKSISEQEQKRWEEIKQEITKCVVFAEQEGMVVYYIPEQARWGGGAQQSIIAQGEPVREGQKMMRIPDLNNMQVVVKVHEALVSSVQVDQEVEIITEAYSDYPLKGRVDFVSTVDSKGDWLAADVKLYQTIILINPDSIKAQAKDFKENKKKEKKEMKLKPGMSCTVRILIGETEKKVPTIPVQSIVDSNSDGDAIIFVRSDENKIDQRKIKIGLANDKYAEVVKGVNVGEQVVMNPSILFKDKKPPRLETKKEKEDAKNKDTVKKPKKDKGKKPAANAGKDKGGANNKPGPGGQPGGRGGMQPTKEQMEQIKKAMVDRFKPLTPEKRKEALMQIPEQWRANAKKMLKDAGIEVPD